MANEVPESKLLNTLQLFLLILCVCLSDSAPESAINLEFGGKEFYAILATWYKNEVQVLATKIANVEKEFEKQMTLLAYSRDLSTAIVDRAVTRIRARGTLTPQGKACIENFDKNLAMKNSALKEQLNTCVDTARTSAKQLAEPGKTKAQDTRNQLTELQKETIQCRKDSGNDFKKMADCAWTKFKAREQTMIDHLKTGHTNIKDAEFDINASAKMANECTFDHILSIQKQLAEILFSFNLCAGEKDVGI